MIVIRSGIAALLLAGPAAASCGDRSAIVANLGAQHHEAQIGAGLQAGGAPFLIEVWVSPQGGWTIIRTTPAGVACVMAAGTHWLIYAPPAPGEDG